MTNSLEKRIGNAARKARVALGLTQEDAAEQIGVSVEFYSRIERGTALPSLKTFIRMAVVFEVSTDRLLGLTEDDQAQRILKEFAAKQPKDPPELRRLFRKLRSTRMNRVRFVILVLHELEKMFDESGDVSDDDDDDLDDLSDGIALPPDDDDEAMDDGESLDDESLDDDGAGDPDSDDDDPGELH